MHLLLYVEVEGGLDVSPVAAPADLSADETVRRVEGRRAWPAPVGSRVSGSFRPTICSIASSYSSLERLPIVHGGR